MVFDDEEWIDLFQAGLEFPFYAVVCEYQEDPYIKQGDKVRVHGLLGEDDLYGVIVSIRKGKNKYAFPIVDLNPIDKFNKNKKLVNDYKCWFSDGKTNK